ncbi:MAG: putative Ig domain-containing protein, partial [Comamonas sp.]
APYTWSLSDAPSWLQIDPQTGVLSGMPDAPAPASAPLSFTATVTDSSTPTARSDSKTLSLTVLPAPLVITTTGSLPEVGEGQAYRQQLLVTGGTAPYSWSVVTGSLPPGLTLDATGLLSGTVTKAALLAGQAGQVTKAAGSFSFGVQVTDSSSPQLQSAEQQLSLQVTAAEVVPPAPTPVPSLGTWAIALLNLAAAVMGVLAWRWRRKPFQA